MIICVCHDVSDRDILETVEKHGARTIPDLQKHISVCETCRICEPYIEDLLDSDAE